MHEIRRHGQQLSHIVSLAGDRHHLLIIWSTFKRMSQIISINFDALRPQHRLNRLNTHGERIDVEWSHLGIRHEKVVAENIEYNIASVGHQLISRHKCTGPTHLVLKMVSPYSWS